MTKAGIGAITPRRSVLFLPASNLRAIQKARTIPADVVVLDLEDAVAPDAKTLGRSQAVTALGEGGFGIREVAIRCNGLDTPWGRDDLAAVAQAGPAAIIVPKITGATDLISILEVAQQAGLPDHTAIWPMIETPAAIFAIREIAGFPRVEAIVVGTNDLSNELRATLRPGRAAVLSHLTTALLGAREAGIVAIDGVWNDIADLEGFTAECQQGADLGFDGKTLIHPGQVEIANQVWSPTAAAISEAERVIAAFEEATAEGRGVVTLDSRMIENLHVDNARRILATAAAINALG